MQQELQTHLVRIIGHMHGLGIAGRIGIDLFVRGIVSLPVRKTHFRLNDSGYLFEEMLRSPRNILRLNIYVCSSY